MTEKKTKLSVFSSMEYIGMGHFVMGYFRMGYFVLSPKFERPSCHGF